MGTRPADAEDTAGAALPPYVDLLWPTLQAVIALGGSAQIDTIDDAVRDLVGLSDEACAVLHGDGPGTEFEYRVAWARTYLKGMGLLANTRRAVWSVTDAGREVTEDRIKPLQNEYVAERRRRRLEREEAAESPRAPSAPVADEVASDDPADDGAWRGDVLAQIRATDDTAFADFVRAVIDGSGGASIRVGSATVGVVDGTSVVRVGLLDFSVFFRFVRPPATLDVDAVHEFRAATIGRGEKGLFVTTGSFTDAARAEAHRVGAPPVTLVDGEGLCDLVLSAGVGIRRTVRTVEDVRCDRRFFASLGSAGR